MLNLYSTRQEINGLRVSVQILNAMFKEYFKVCLWDVLVHTGNVIGLIRRRHSIELNLTVDVFQSDLQGHTRCIQQRRNKLLQAHQIQSKMTAFHCLKVIGREFSSDCGDIKK